MATFSRMRSGIGVSRPTATLKMGISARDSAWRWRAGICPGFQFAVGQKQDGLEILEPLQGLFQGGVEVRAGDGVGVGEGAAKSSTTNFGLAFEGQPELGGAAGLQPFGALTALIGQGQSRVFMLSEASMRIGDFGGRLRWRCWTYSGRRRVKTSRSTRKIADIPAAPPAARALRRQLARLSQAGRAKGQRGDEHRKPGGKLEWFTGDEMQAVFRTSSSSHSDGTRWGSLLVRRSERETKARWLDHSQQRLGEPNIRQH